MSTARLEVGPSTFIPRAELHVVFSRSGGPGGQNVNKVESRVELLFDVVNSAGLTEEQKSLVAGRLRRRIDAAGRLRIVVQDSRSQWKNRETAVERFVEVLRGALAAPKARKPTRSTAGARARRIEAKKKRGAVKKMRRVRGDE
jgi:ribosome-associated protein